ncbi:Crp/Fnr family transcriptional regulator [Azospirillum himalayense]|uniref:Crp/Fnr family transcriptional regulator n=1 Tax=Azospirillum himalayense TaxID=654847 RepID=A0ABW0GAB4_9PROT
MRRFDPVFKRQLLLQHDLFRCISGKDVDAILAFAGERRCKNGQTIFQKGDPGSGMMAVLLGNVRIGTVSESGKEIVFKVVETGGIFGEIALLDGRPRTADATAIGDCVLLVIERRDFVPFLEKSPQVAIKMLEVMCDRLRQTSLLVEDLALLDLPQRMARLLVRLGASYGRRTRDGLRIDLKLSQKDLGNLIATSRESINKQLRTWQDEELITVENGYITLLQPQQIADYGQPAR